MNSVPITTVIYVEDSADEVFLARRILERTGLSIGLMHFECAERLHSAVSSGLVYDRQTSILVVDLNLQFCSGNDVIRHLHETAFVGPFLTGICTGSEDPVDRQDANAAGADFFVPKPLVIDGLKAIGDGVDQLIWIADSPDGYPLRRVVESHRDSDIGADYDAAVHKSR